MRGAILVLLARAEAWTTISQSQFGAQLHTIQSQMYGNRTAADPNKLLGFLWSSPHNVRDRRGLGGGITWAWDPQLCELLKPRFGEDFAFMEFVGCDEIKAAMHRGFASWSDNHALISFIDVTDECAKLGELHQGCRLAELWVTALGSSAGKERRLEAARSASLEVEAAVSEGQAADSSTAATAVPHADYTSNFTYTNGISASMTVVGTHHATISFNPTLCWYLDSTFCSFFHQLKRHTSPDTVLMGGRLTIFGVWSLCLLVVALQLGTILRTQLSAHPGLRSRCSSVIGAVARWSVLGTMFRLLLLVAPPIFFQLIFLPCFECYDFEAAATHEVGHVLGLSHPDTVATSACCGNAPGQNVYHAQLAAGERMDGARCSHPWDGVVAGVPPGQGSAAGGVRPSIMMAFTQHNPNVCLTQDDVEALHVLYPDCDAAISRPVCFKFKHNIGWLRLGVYVLFPTLLMLLLLMLLNGCVRQHQSARLKSAKDLLGKREVDLNRARRKSLQQERRADELRAMYDEQLATEAERVSQAAQRLSVQMVEAHLQGLEHGSKVQFDPAIAISRSPTAPPPRRAPARGTTSRFGAAMTWVASRMTRQSSDHSSATRPTDGRGSELRGSDTRATDAGRTTDGDLASGGPTNAEACAAPRPVARQGTKLTVRAHGVGERESSVPLVEASEEAAASDEDGVSDDGADLPTLPSHVVPPRLQPV